MNDKPDPRLTVIEKALKDPAFKAELLKNPAAAVEKLTGVKVPAGLTIKVVSDSASTVHLILPAGPSKSGISDQDLSKVAGGARGSYSHLGYCSDDSTTQPFECSFRI